MSAQLGGPTVTRCFSSVALASIRRICNLCNLRNLPFDPSTGLGAVSTSNRRLTALSNVEGRITLVAAYLFPAPAVCRRLPAVYCLLFPAFSLPASPVYCLSYYVAKLLRRVAAARSAVGPEPLGMARGRELVERLVEGSTGFLT